ncbi:hypothetical protein C8Q80DRAFT_1122305 [Daedaleopsis nitida]|nr:hypothetical protein C8Q80DRAFT_1122305 [Daedaleopsis nitida]
MSRYSVQLGSSQLPPARVPNIGTSVANGCSPSHLPSGSTFSPPYFSAYTMWNGLPPQDPMNRRPQLTILRQSKYTRGQPFDNEEQRIPTISFGALNMHEALEDDCASLEDRMRPAWAKELRTATKLSIVFSFDGHPTPYTHQVHILRAGGEPPERARLAGVVARELQRFMAENPDQPLRAHGRSVGFEELLLVEVEHVSKGSLQPTIGVASK